MTLKSPWEFEDPSCAGIGVELFYRNEFQSDQLESNSRNELNQIKEICQECPCLSECAEWGINKERWGIWGGLTPTERKNVRRKRRRQGILNREIELLP